MNENNGFILKPEMYNQEEWCKMFMKSIETINNLQSKIDKAIDKLNKRYEEDKEIFNGVYDFKFILDFEEELLNDLKEDK